MSEATTGSGGRPKRRVGKALLPVMGLLLAVALAGVAYGLSFPLVAFAEDQDEDLKKEFDSFREDMLNRDNYEDIEMFKPENAVEYIVAGVLWILLFGLASFVFAAAVGKDEESKSAVEMGPSPANRKASIKQMKKDLREAKKRDRERKRRTGK